MRKSITPEELAKRFNQPARPKPVDDGWVRETMTVGRGEAEAKLGAWLMKYPPAAYWSEVEWWQELPGLRRATDEAAAVGGLSQKAVQSGAAGSLAEPKTASD